MIIKVNKSKHILRLFKEDKLIYSCAVCLGKCPVGPKICEGDNKTPEGTYRICSKNPQSRFHLSMGISYPSEKDALKAFKGGLIDVAALNSITEAEHVNKRPPWDTPLGGWIMLHGEHPDGRDGDWTAGCIAVSNTDIEKLFDIIEIGDIIEIEA